MDCDNESKIIISSLENQDQAKDFILFLKSEIARHKMDIDNAVDLIYTIVRKFKLDEILEE